MKYTELPEGYKKERICAMMRNLDRGEALRVSHLFLEEIVFLKNMYGAELKKTGGYIYRAMEQEVLF